MTAQLQFCWIRRRRRTGGGSCFAIRTTPAAPLARILEGISEVWLICEYMNSCVPEGAGCNRSKSV
jgi:hypothetical protein